MWADTDLAYMAGVLDSDGYISIHRNTKKAGPADRRRQVCYYSAKVGISGTRRQPHDLAVSMFGGRIHTYIPKVNSFRVQYQWVIESQLAVPVLEAVRPYLRVKGEQADLTLTLQRMIQTQWEQIKLTLKPPYKIPAEMHEERERLFLAVRALNQGPAGTRIQREAAGV